MFKMFGSCPRRSCIVLISCLLCVNQQQIGDRWVEHDCSFALSDDIDSQQTEISLLLSPGGCSSQLSSGKFFGSSLASVLNAKSDIFNRFVRNCFCYCRWPAFPVRSRVL